MREMIIVITAKLTERTTYIVSDITLSALDHLFPEQPREPGIFGPSLVEKETGGQKGQMCLLLDQINSKQEVKPSEPGWETARAPPIGSQVDAAFSAFPSHLAPLLARLSL